MENETKLPRWIVVRLGNDLNWWVEEASDEMYWPREGLSILDPRQLNDLCEQLSAYQAVGFKPQDFHRTFALFEMQSELSDGRMRLRPVRQATDENRPRLFALPRFVSEDESQYLEFVETLTALRVKLLNKTHKYKQPVDTLDIEEELQAQATDRYFGGSGIHCYDELNDILSWSPGEYGGTDSTIERRSAAQNMDEEEEEQGNA